MRYVTFYQLCHLLIIILLPYVETLVFTRMKYVPLRKTSVEMFRTPDNGITKVFTVLPAPSVIANIVLLATPNSVRTVN